jgi:hypothetical protein
MTRQLAYGTVRDHPRKVMRVLDEILDYLEIDHVTEQMRIHVISSLTPSHAFAPPYSMPR